MALPTPEECLSGRFSQNSQVCAHWSQDSLAAVLVAEFFAQIQSDIDAQSIVGLQKQFSDIAE